MLGWVCERAAGRRMADLVSDADLAADGRRVRRRHHLRLRRDRRSTTAGSRPPLRDLARFGQLLLDDGRVGERQVVPAAWLADAYTPTPDVREAFARTDNEPMLPGGWYRNQFWFFHPESGPVLLCLGIHGQMVFVDRGHPHGGGQAVVVAGRAERGLPGGDPAGVPGDRHDLGVRAFGPYP